MTDPELERALFHWHAVVRTAPHGWARDFALSIAKASRRPWWRPTDRQAQAMRRMVAELFTGAGGNDGEVLER